MHTGRDPLHVGNFRRAEPENIARAESSLILLSEGAARRRQHRHAERQAGHECEISDFEPINSHHRPRKGLTLRSSAARFATLESIEINQDRIEISADPSRFENSYAPEFSITACIAASWFQKWNIVTGGRGLANENAPSCFGPNARMEQKFQFQVEGEKFGRI